jgi:hypothetical protein
MWYKITHEQFPEKILTLADNQWSIKFINDFIERHLTVD